MKKSALQGIAAQKGDKQLSFKAHIDTLAVLTWIADRMELPTGSIAKVVNVSIVLESAIQKVGRG